MGWGAPLGKGLPSWWPQCSGVDDPEQGDLRPGLNALVQVCLPAISHQKQDHQCSDIADLTTK